MKVSSTLISPNYIYNNIATVRHPARLTISQPAVRETVSEARELIGRDVAGGLFPTMLAVGREATVAAGGAALGGTAEPAAAGGVPGEDETEPSRLGTIFTVALAQFALYPSRDLAAVGLIAKTIPD
jgi:hypothetical protein